MAYIITFHSASNTFDRIVIVCGHQSTPEQFTNNIQRGNLHETSRSFKPMQIEHFTFQDSTDRAFNCTGWKGKFVRGCHR